MTTGPNAHIASAFSAAARTYDAAAQVQRHAADRLAAHLSACYKSRLAPRFIVEIGCGTGFLTERLDALYPAATLVATDLSVAMIGRLRQRIKRPLCAAMDAEHAALRHGAADLIAGSLVAQWFLSPRESLCALAGSLPPGGRLALTCLGPGTFAEWQQALDTAGAGIAPRDYPAPETLASWLSSFGDLDIESEIRCESYADGMAFLRAIKAIGAQRQAGSAMTVPAAALRRAAAILTADGAQVTYRLQYVILERNGAGVSTGAS